jgi:hypothetical protein
MNFLLIPFTAATICLFINRNKSPHYKLLFIIVGIITLVQIIVTAWLGIAMRNIE